MRTCVAGFVFLFPVAISAQQPDRIALPPATASVAAEFSELTTIRELADERVPLFDRKEERLVVVDLTNGSVRDIGGRGRGPGEYESLVRLLALGGDSTLAVDLSRWLILHGDSVVVTLPPDTPAIQAVWLWPLGADGVGHVLSSRLGRRGDPAQVSLVDRASGRSQPVARLRSGVRRATPRTITAPDGRPAMEISRIPLDAQEHAELFADGWLAVGRLEPYRVDWRAPDGRWIHGAPLPFRAVPMTDREKRAYAERNSWATRATDWPEVLPPFDRTPPSLLTAPDGLLLIRRLPTADQPDTRYDVVDRRGVLLGPARDGA